MNRFLPPVTHDYDSFLTFSSGLFWPLGLPANSEKDKEKDKEPEKEVTTTTTAEEPSSTSETSSSSKNDFKEEQTTSSPTPVHLDWLEDHANEVDYVPEKN